MSRLKSLRKLLTWQLVVFGFGAALVLAGFVLDRAIEEPLRRDIEAQFNEKLTGYTGHVGRVDFHLLGFSLDLERVVISQNAHPDPPVLYIPHLSASVHWKALLSGRLVADFIFENPSVYVDLVQLEEEASDSIPFSEHGWQDAFASIYPLRINELQVKGGTLAYQDNSDFRPLHARHIELLASNIRNIRSPEREYPSTVHAEGALFDSGQFSIDGHADFLAKPVPGVKVAINLDGVELDYFEPVVRRYNLRISEGVLWAHAQVEHASLVQIVDIDSITIRDAAVDYIHSSVPNQRVEAVAHKITDTAHEVMNDSQSLVLVRKLVMENGTIGFVNRDISPAYRVYISDATFHLENLSSRAEDGLALASLSGKFMGTGEVQGSARFFPEGKQANFSAKLKVAETQLKPMNDLLRAHGSFDVVGGIFSLYTEFRVRDGFINGYVKPMFRDLDVYDPAQDKRKNACRKFYEALVGGVAKLLENRNRDEVATVARISGPVEDPNASTVQIIGRLIQNAFFKAILPGFEREFKRAEPLPYRSAKRRLERAQAPGRG